MTVWVSRELLDSALARPLHRAGNDEPDRAERAAVYALAIAQNHPYGNRRTAFVAMELFLRLNGCRFTVHDAEAVAGMLQMAACASSEPEFTGWAPLHTADG